MVDGGPAVCETTGVVRLGGHRGRLLAPLAVATLAAVLAGAPPARAEGPVDARAVFDEGIALEKRGEHEAALARFRDAARIRPTPGVRFHEAYCLEMLGKLVSALATYELADTAARDQGKVDIQKAVAARVAPLRARIPTLAMHLATGSPSVTTLRVDDAIVSPEVLDGRPVPVDPGDHVVVAGTADGRTAEARTTVAVAASADVTIAFAVAESPPGPMPRVRPSAVPIALSAGAVALLGTAIVSFLVAGNVAADARKTCPTRMSCDDERTRVRALDAVALGSAVAGVGLGAIAIVLFARPSRSDETVKVGATPAGLLVEGTF